MDNGRRRAAVCGQGDAVAGTLEHRLGHPTEDRIVVHYQE